MPQSCLLSTACALCCAYTHIHTTTTIFQENASKTMKIEESFNNSFFLSPLVLLSVSRHNSVRIE